MKIAVISPVAGLEAYSSMSRTHLVLAQVKDPVYMDYYKQRKQAGDTLILDNGAYEGATFDAGRYIELLHEYSPTVAVLPDTPYQDGKITFTDSITFMKLALESGYQGEFMAVPQAIPNDWQNWWVWTRSFLNIEAITWIGLSKLLKKTFEDFPEYSRAQLAQAITRIRPEVKIHALGMLDGSLIDFDYLIADNVVKSLDTGAPVWRGWNGYNLTDQSWPDRPLDFYADPPHPSCHTTIYRNLSILGVIHDSRIHRDE